MTYLLVGLLIVLCALLLNAVKALTRISHAQEMMTLIASTTAPNPANLPEGWVVVELEDEMLVQTDESKTVMKVAEIFENNTVRLVPAVQKQREL